MYVAKGTNVVRWERAESIGCKRQKIEKQEKFFVRIRKSCKLS